MTFSSGDELRDALDKIAKINQLLRKQVNFTRCKELIAQTNAKSRLLMWVYMLRTLADYGLQHNIKFNLIGDEQLYVKHAINLSKMYPNISIIVKIYLISLLKN
jgi:hypothetical protein